MAGSRLIRRKGPTPEQMAEAAKPMTRMEERREELRARFTEMQWDLGGAAYEMAARDYFRLDVLAGMAARLQIVDAELAEIERMARLERAGAEGSCAGCGSLHARGAIYCWRCGRNLFEAPARPALVAAPEPARPATTANGSVPVQREVPAPADVVVEPSPAEPLPADMPLADATPEAVDAVPPVEEDPVSAYAAEQVDPVPVTDEPEPFEPPLVTDPVTQDDPLPTPEAAASVAQVELVAQVEPVQPIAPVEPEEPVEQVAEPQQAVEIAPEAAEPAVPQRPFGRPWAGASRPGPVAKPGPVTVPPFAGAVEVPTFERPAGPADGSGPASGGA